MVNEVGYSKAIELLHQASTPLGFVASVKEHDNYKRIWTRDGVVNGLASLLSGDVTLINTFESTLQTIFEHQHPIGFMPSNVSADGKVSYGGTVGRADNPAWAVIGLCQYALVTNHKSLASRFEKHVEKCFFVMDAWEFNGKHLMYVPQSGDWADEYIQHGYILFDQLLRIWALRLAANVYHRDDWQTKADTITTVIEQNFWNNNADELYAANLKHQMAQAPDMYWFLGFNPARIYSQFDLQANSLALLLHIGKTDQQQIVLTFLADVMKQITSILPSFYPAVEKTDWEMKELENNYAYTFRNSPHEFHNGGLWPVWNGFLTAALTAHQQTDDARKVTAYLHEANSALEWEMNECFHGQTKKPIGVARCTWSAGGAVIAEKSIEGKKLFFYYPE
ncbi:MAG: hypothetical protein JNM57_12815 [Cyclobacteriaceae bacterium]|nr:hypothetical protein [Cyclobacteriaceae bacterium]